MILDIERVEQNKFLTKKQLLRDVFEPNKKH